MQRMCAVKVEQRRQSMPAFCALNALPKTPSYLLSPCASTPYRTCCISRHEPRSPNVCIFCIGMAAATRLTGADFCSDPRIYTLRSAFPSLHALLADCQAGYHNRQLGEGVASAPILSLHRLCQADALLPPAELCHSTLSSRPGSSRAPGEGRPPLSVSTARHC